ncbi:MAG: efflux RND transporter periplasmic adaptor subunit [Myxococcales bacterium]|nr:efflux RND transporter periplasmic adaptor subunit [Myxococcales bacterium]
MVILLLACGSSSDRVPTAPVQSGTFQVRLAVPGTVEAVKETVLRTPELKGRPSIAWLAKHGSIVAKGDRIVEFDRLELEKRLDTALNELELARTKILQNEAKLALSVADASAGITKAELDLELARMRRTESDTVPLVDREEARVSEVKSSMAIESARSSLDSVKLESRAETQLLQLEVAQKEREVEKIRDQLEHTVLTAPSDGVVLLKTNWDDTHWKVGNSPWQGSELAALPDLSEMKVEAEVHEVDSTRVAVGQKALVTLEAFPDAPVGGEVAKVADLAVAKGEDGIKVLEVEVSLDETREEMKPGLSARVELVLDEVPDALWIPIESVWKDGDERYVWTSGLTGWSRTPVVLGTENDTHVVVTSGVAAGDLVALVDPQTERERPPAEP